MAATVKSFCGPISAHVWCSSQRPSGGLARVDLQVSQRNPSCDGRRLQLDQELRERQAGHAQQRAGGRDACGVDAFGEKTDVGKVPIDIGRGEVQANEVWRASLFESRG